MPNKRVYLISIFGFFSPTYLFIWPYLFSFSTLLDKQIFHSSCLFDHKYTFMTFMYLNIHPTRLIGTWEYIFLNIFSGPKFKNPGQHLQMYIMYHLLRAAGPRLPQNIMAFSNQIDFETDPQGKRTSIFIQEPNRGRNQIYSFHHLLGCLEGP